jgi:hypothetical protein
VPKLPDIKDPQRLDELQSALHNWNFAFCREDNGETASFPKMSIVNGWLFLVAGDAVTNADVEKDAEKAVLIRWLIENVQFPQEVVKELQLAEQRLGNCSPRWHFGLI